MLLMMISTVKHAVKKMSSTLAACIQQHRVGPSVEPMMMGTAS
jgi:hypothetical protein